MSKDGTQCPTLMSHNDGMLYPTHLFTCTEPENLREYFTPFSDLINMEIDARFNLLDESAKEHLIFSEMRIELNDEEKAELKETCSPDALTSFSDYPGATIPDLNKFKALVHLTLKIPHCDSDLKILKSKKEWWNKLGKMPPFAAPRKEYTKLFDQDLVPYSDEVLFIVKLYQPFQYSIDSNYFRKDRIKCNFEIAILGSQTLADLRDILLCSNDLGYTSELNSPNDTIKSNIKEDYPSGFLFIENCFYNDFRNSKAIDYSDPIIKWAETNKVLAKYTTGSMDTTKIIDLRMRFGYPYIYQHQADCEHVVIFAEARLLRETDPLELNKYPYIQSETTSRNLMCYLCGVDIVRYVVTDSDRLPHKYSFFCKECLLSYNYNKGKKIGSFKLYPFFDKAGVLFRDKSVR